MTKIVLTRSMVPGDIQYIRDGLDREAAGKYCFVIPSEFTEEAIVREASNADILLGPYVTKRILEAAKGLRLIQVPWTGMDTFDFSALQGVDIPVCNSHSNADSVAEICVALVLDLLKKISYHDRKMRIGNWNRDQNPLSLKSKMLSRQTVCILGFGNIGSRAGKRIAAFGAKVIAVSDRAAAGEIATEVYPHGRVSEAVGEADIVICALPLTDKTRGMINHTLFERMKDGVVLVNVSRAAVIDEDDLWDALEAGRVGAFGSDVWWNAPKRGETASYPSAKHEFWKRDNVLMSPHRAGFVEGSLPHLDGAIENMTALIEGRPLGGFVNIGKGY
ncbi:MAG: NAD(P)-binding domain-containing protein [Lachnospiraceae bacterium]|nr:NAD(P)-binding domain-containing protein [Lachnospiraceae bacterium]